jgi:alpha-tubulin suppressor-like RCC1 family protein
MVPLPALQWSSSAENIAAVDEAGRIHAIRRGQAIITVRSGAAAASVAVEVTGFADLSTTDTDTTCAITDNRHEIYCWGNAANNRIFAKSAPNAPSYSAPVQIQPGELPPNAKIVSLAIGRWATCALTDTGRAYCWGDSAQRAVPTALQAGEMPPGAKLSSLAVGASEACGIASDSQIYCWGVSNPAKPARMILGEIPPNEKLTAIGVGRSGACVIADGDGYCWLSGEKPQLVSPGDLPASVKLTSLSVSDQAACALGDDGHAYCFDQASKELPVWKLVPFAVKLKDFAARQYCAIGENRHLYCGGKALPVAVAFQKITCAPNDCAALSEDGRIYSWGAAQNEAELGHPANPNPALPELINAPQ